MSQFPTGTRVRITGDHPWAGYAGTVLDLRKPSIGILPPMYRVQLDQEQDCPYRHECFVEPEKVSEIK